MIINFLNKVKNRLIFIIYFIFEILTESRIEKEIKKIQKIKEKNINSIKYKLKKLEELFNKNLSNPFICEALARREVVWRKNPNDGLKKFENYENLMKEWQNKKSLSNLSIPFIPEHQVVGSFGNYWPLFNYFMYRYNIEKSQSKPNLILKKKTKITNKYLFNYFKQHLNLIENTRYYYQQSFNTKVFKIPMEITLPYQNKHYPWFASMNFINQKLKNVEKKNFNFFNMNEKDLIKGKKILNELGIPENSWYVTLHVREGIGNALFNSNPLTYLKAIKEITKRGGYVFRVGDKSMTKLPKINGLIDYPFTKYKSEFFDIFLAATCKFCIGTSSGFWSVPTFFNKPVVLVNYLPILDYYSLSEKSFFLPKSLKYKKDNKEVSLADIFSFPHGYLNTDLQFELNEVLYTDNTEDEIRDTVIEILNIFENNNKDGVNEKKNIEIKNYLNKLNSKIYEYPLEAIGNLSSSFLNKY